MPPAGFELAIPASERLQTHSLDRAATGIGLKLLFSLNGASCTNWFSHVPHFYRTLSRSVTKTPFYVINPALCWWKNTQKEMLFFPFLKKKIVYLSYMFFFWNNRPKTIVLVRTSNCSLNSLICQILQFAEFLPALSFWFNESRYLPYIIWVHPRNKDHYYKQQSDGEYRCSKLIK
jgi:hypothetical protein